MKKFFPCCIFPILLIALIGCAQFSNAAEQAEVKPPLTKAIAADSTNDNNYLIGNGDVIEINVWREPMLSGETFVRTDGKISLALLGDVQAAGLTTMQLKEDIQKKLEKFVEAPTVTVILKSPVSQKYYMVGEVKSPGEYDLTKDLTFLQAIARTGGFTEWADKSNILLIRMENGVEKRMPINYKDIVKGKNEADNVHLQANDIIVVTD